MAVFQVTAPDGAKYKITAPDEQQGLDEFYKQFPQYRTETAPPDIQAGSRPPTAADIGKPDTPAPPAKPRIIEGAKMGFGESRISPETIKKYPVLSRIFQGLELPGRAAGAAGGALAGYGAEMAERWGMSDADANRLERDLTAALTVGGAVGGARYGGGMPLSTRPGAQVRMGPAPTAESIRGQISPQGPMDIQTLTRAVSEAAEKGKGAIETAEKAVPLEQSQLQELLENQQKRLTQTVARSQAQQPRESKEAAEIVGEKIKEKAATEKARVERIAAEAYGREGEFIPKAFADTGTRLQGNLSALGEIFDKQTAPEAAGSFDYLNRAPGLRIEERDGKAIPITLKGVEAARKGLNDRYRDAYARSRRSNDWTDVRGMRRVIDAFDDHVETSVANGLFRGDPEALSALRNARRELHEYHKKWTAQPGDEVGRDIQRILKNQARPEDIANYLHGAGQIGGTGRSVNLFDRLESLFGKDSQEMDVIRQAIWDRALQRKQGISELVNSTLGKRAFSVNELKMMREHDIGRKNLTAYMQQVPSIEKAEKANAEYQRVFSGKELTGTGMKDIFDRIINGTATPEHIRAALFDQVGKATAPKIVYFIDAVEKIIGKNSDGMTAMRQGLWDQITKGEPKMQAKALRSLLDGPGKSVAERLYMPQQRASMRRYMANADKKMAGVRYRLGEHKAQIAKGMAIGAGIVAGSYAAEKLGLGGVAHFMHRYGGVE